MHRHEIYTHLSNIKHLPLYQKQMKEETKLNYKLGKSKKPRLLSNESTEINEMRHSVEYSFIPEGFETYRGIK